MSGPNSDSVSGLLSALLLLMVTEEKNSRGGSVLTYSPLKLTPVPVVITPTSSPRGVKIL